MTLSDSDFNKAVLIDLGGDLKQFADTCLAYRDLSASGSVAEAARELFDTLRWAETVEGASLVVLPYVASEVIADLLRKDSKHPLNISQAFGKQNDGQAIEEQASLGPGLADRMFRAASGSYPSPPTQVIRLSH